MRLRLLGILGMTALFCAEGMAFDLISGGKIADINENPEKYKNKEIVIQDTFYKVLKDQLERDQAKGKYPFLIENMKKIRCYVLNNLPYRDLLFSMQEGDPIEIQGEIKQKGSERYFQVREMKRVEKRDDQMLEKEDDSLFEKTNQLIREINNNPQKWVNREIELIVHKPCKVHSMPEKDKHNLSKYGYTGDRYKRCFVEGLEESCFIRIEFADVVSEPLGEGEILRLNGYVRRFEVGGGAATKKGRRKGLKLYHLIVNSAKREGPAQTGKREYRNIQDQTSSIH